MEYHYTVIYDDEVKAWSVEPDPSMYYAKGNIYDKNADLLDGWFFPEEGSAEESLDYTLYSTLKYIVCTFPIPQEVS